MKEAAEDRGEAAPQPGHLAAWGARVVGACIGTLEKLRNRLQGSAEHEESAQAGAKGRSAATAQTPPSSPIRQQKSFLHRALILLLCLLLGGGAGTLVSYRMFSTTIAAHGAVIERMQDEIDQSKKQEALNLSAKIKYQKEANEYRKALIESQQEGEALKTQVADGQRQVEELNKQLNAIKKIDKPVGKPGRAASPAAIERKTPLKTGTCVTGTTNLSENLTDCIDKFNRP